LAFSPENKKQRLEQHIKSEEKRRARLWSHISNIAKKNMVIIQTSRLPDSYANADALQSYLAITIGGGALPPKFNEKDQLVRNVFSSAKFMAQTYNNYTCVPVNEASVALFYSFLLQAYIPQMQRSSVMQEKQILLFPEFNVSKRGQTNPQKATLMKTKKKKKNEEEEKGEQKNEPERKKLLLQNHEKILQNKGIRPDLLVGYRDKNYPYFKNFSERPRIIIEFKKTKESHDYLQIYKYVRSFYEAEFRHDTIFKYLVGILLDMDGAFIYVMKEGMIGHFFELKWKFGNLSYGKSDEVHEFFLVIRLINIFLTRSFIL